MPPRHLSREGDREQPPQPETAFNHSLSPRPCPDADARSFRSLAQIDD
jgi:hypothetical protein